ncbi:hypothetical protein R80B4_03022 [Fibrobacteres bacterium R8-0-B4]
MSIITKHGRTLLVAAVLAGMFVWTAFAQEPTLDKLQLIPIGTTAY